MTNTTQMRALKISGDGVINVANVDHVTSKENLNLQVLAATICGSDLKILRGEMEGIKYPLIPGHEWVAKVLEAPQEHKHLIGKRIVPNILHCCYQCFFCRKELPNLCEHLEEPGLTQPGGFAEYTGISPANAHIISDKISDLEATLLEPLAVALYAIERVEITEEDKVLIIGGGGIGQLIGQCCRLKKPKTITIVDNHQYRLNTAKSLFADQILDPQKVVIDRYFANNADIKPTKIFEVTGSIKGLNLALSAAQKNAEIAIVGYSGRDRIAIKSSEIMVKHLTLKGVLSPTNTLPLAISLLENGEVNLKPLVTHVFNLEDSVKAFDVAQFSKHEALRVAIAT